MVFADLDALGKWVSITGSDIFLCGSHVILGNCVCLSNVHTITMYMNCTLTHSPMVMNCSSVKCTSELTDNAL